MKDSNIRFNPARSVTLVLGGTGKTGRRVAERLKARDVETRIASRSGDITLPAGHVPEPFIDVDDIADVADGVRRIAARGTWSANSEEDAA